MESSLRRDATDKENNPSILRYGSKTPAILAKQTTHTARKTTGKPLVGAKGVAGLDKTVQRIGLGEVKNGTPVRTVKRLPTTARKTGAKSKGTNLVVWQDDAATVDSPTAAPAPAEAVSSKAVATTAEPEVEYAPPSTHHLLDEWRPDPEEAMPDASLVDCKPRFVYMTKEEMKIISDVQHNKMDPLPVPPMPDTSFFDDFDPEADLDLAFDPCSFDQIQTSKK
ncbi:hypothetical protein HDU91_006824 [Kappamyces sp. JEL0680]|nr:hypothetical protein HDU91_006824 [Kappamyces sp. JEL0680]